MTRWVHPGIVTLGGWLVLGAATIVPRSAALAWSNLGAGVSLVLLGFLFGSPRTWVPWATAFVGVWVLLAPFVIGAPSLIAYAHGTVVGGIIIMLAVMDLSFRGRR